MIIKLDSKAIKIRYQLYPHFNEINLDSFFPQYLLIFKTN
jgi:hypothetical protein